MIDHQHQSHNGDHDREASTISTSQGTATRPAPSRGRLHPRWPGLCSGLLIRGTFTWNLQLTSQFWDTHFDVWSTPWPGGCLYSAPWKEEHSPEKRWRQRGSSHGIICWKQKESKLSSLHCPRLPTSVQPPSQSQHSSPPAPLEEAGCMPYGAGSRGCGDRAPPCSALPSPRNLMWKSKYPVLRASGLPKIPDTLANQALCRTTNSKL